MQEYKKVCHEYSACSESLLGLKAADKGDMPAAVEHLQHSCLLGNMSACFNLGLCYETGSGVPQDEAKVRIVLSTLPILTLNLYFSFLCLLCRCL